MRGRTTRRRVTAVCFASFVALAATLLTPMAASADTSPPVVSTVSPADGLTAGGATVTLTGSGFTGATVVAFGNVDSPSFTVVSDSEITATTPGRSSGKVAVVVTTPAGSSAVSTATVYTYFGPYVTKVSPNELPDIGGTVDVTGLGFAGVESVQVGTANASFVKVTNMVLKVTLPAQPVGIEDVTVTTSVGTSPMEPADRVSFVVPAVNIIMPTSGPANRTTTVELTGVGLIGATQVMFGSVPAARFAVHGPTAIASVAPAQAASTVPVTVDFPGGVTTTAGKLDYFTYKPPTITRVTPSSGPTTGGTSVLIKGTLLSGVSAVNFGTVAAQGFALEAGGILATSPSHSAGMVDITVTASAGNSSPVTADHFTFT